MLGIKIITPKKSPVEKLAKESPEIIKAAVAKNMRLAQKIAKQNVKGGGSSKTKLNVRSARLRNSITTKVEQEGITSRGLIGTNVIYARIHEEGGVIKSKKAGGYLTIPLTHKTKSGKGVKSYSATTKAGAQRFSASDLSLGKTFIARSKKGNLLIFAHTSKTNYVPIFLLLKQVKIPKRPYLMPALERVVKPLTKDIKEGLTDKEESVGKR